MTFKVKDFYFHKAKKEHYLARSVYKLEEIDQKYKIFAKARSSEDFKILDLGYFPGSWVQYALEKIGPTGLVVGVDIQSPQIQLGSVPNLKIFERDFLEIKDLQELGVSSAFDILLSDMAPKTTGVKSVDQIRSFELVQQVFDLTPLFLKKGGNLVVKIFESSDSQKAVKDQKGRFKETHILRPKSTRTSSKEIFFIGKSFLGGNSENG